MIEWQMKKDNINSNMDWLAASPTKKLHQDTEIEAILYHNHYMLNLNKEIDNKIQQRN